MICQNCQHEFDEDESRISCNGCLARGLCCYLRCPKCGMETAREPAFLDRVRLFFRRLAHGCMHLPANAPCLDTAKQSNLTLTDMHNGETVLIEKFSDLGHVRKFMSLGILPGMSVTVLKQYPAVVLRAGYSEFAFDRQLAGTIRVRRITGDRLAK